MGVTVRKGEEKDLTTQMDLLPIVDAPVQEGQLLGNISILHNGNVVFKTDLVAVEEVAKGSWWAEFRKVLGKTIAL